MIEIRLSLPYGHIYVGGQTINCTLSFVNSVDADVDNGDKAAAVFLSWATVQLECVANLSAKAAACSKLAMSTHASRALGRKGSIAELVIFQGQPKLLFCDCNLMPNSSRTVDFSEQLPTDAPPSFDGEAVKIFYRLTIGVQRPNQPIKLAKIPIRVLPLPMASVAFTMNASPLRRTFSDSFRANGNPFMEDLERERDSGNGSNSSPSPPSPLFEPPFISSSRTYTINAGIDSVSKKPRLVGTLNIDKQIVRIGDAVVGLFDFGRSSVQALKWSAKLCCEELIPGDSNSSSDPISMGVNVVAQHEELCVHSVVSSLFLPVPPDVTPTFESGIVQLRWRIHFEFTILKADKRLAEAEQSNDSGGFTSWRLLLPGDGSIVPNSQTQATETLSWDMDIKLIAANPRLLTALHYLPPINTVTVH